MDLGLKIILIAMFALSISLFGIIKYKTSPITGFHCSSDGIYLLEYKDGHIVKKSMSARM